MYKQKTWQEMSRFAKRWVGSLHLGITCQFHEINCWSSRLEQSSCSLKAFSRLTIALSSRAMLACAFVCSTCLPGQSYAFVPWGCIYFSSSLVHHRISNTRGRRTKLFRGPMHYWCAWGLSASTARRGQGLARGCPPRLWRRCLPLPRGKLQSRNQ